MVEIGKLLEDVREDLKALAWEGSFEEYLNMAIANPKLSRHSHARIYDMVQWAGVTPGLDGVPQYKLFAGQIFGMDRALDRLVQFFNAASSGLEVRKRILLLMGPPASGKSSTVNLLKSGLERYTRTDEGAIYAIKGCPMQEDPLHLIPEERREEVEREYGLRIEGDLCPRCRYNLARQCGGDIAKMRVHRVNFSQSAGVGIGTFVATSPQGQDLSRLVGSVDVSYMTEDRLEGAGKGLRLDGELQAANRGIMEFIEIFKSDERFLAVMLGVTQEQVIKLGSFGSVYADEAIIAHSNEEEYNNFASNKETAALLDRLILVPVPYAVRVRDEVRTCAKMLREGRSGSSNGDGTGYGAGPHVSPLTIPTAAVMSVMSRLEQVPRAANLPRASLVDKLKLYDGQVLPLYTREDVEKLRQASPQEGMFGLSPRYVINRLADAITRDEPCLTPFLALKSLIDGLVERAGIPVAERERMLALVPDVVKELKEQSVQAVMRAATDDFQEKAGHLFRRYIFDAELYLRGTGGGTVSTDPPDERVMRQVEGALNLRDSERRGFRQTVYDNYTHLRREDPDNEPDYTGIPAIRSAVEMVLFPRRDEVRLTIDPRKKDAKRTRGRERIYQRLLSDFGYCEHCARDVLQVALRTLQGKEAISYKRGKLTWE